MLFLFLRWDLHTYVLSGWIVQALPWMMQGSESGGWEAPHLVPPFPCVPHLPVFPFAFVVTLLLFAVICAPLLLFLFVPVPAVVPALPLSLGHPFWHCPPYGLVSSLPLFPLCPCTHFPSCPFASCLCAPLPLCPFDLVLLCPCVLLCPQFCPIAFVFPLSLHRCLPLYPLLPLCLLDHCAPLAHAPLYSCAPLSLCLDHWCCCAHNMPWCCCAPNINSRMQIRDGSRAWILGRERTIFDD